MKSNLGKSCSGNLSVSAGLYGVPAPAELCPCAGAWPAIARDMKSCLKEGDTQKLGKCTLSHHYACPASHWSIITQCHNPSCYNYKLKTSDQIIAFMVASIFFSPSLIVKEYGSPDLIKP